MYISNLCTHSSFIVLELDIELGPLLYTSGLQFRTSIQLQFKRGCIDFKLDLKVLVRIVNQIWMPAIGHLCFDHHLTSFKKHCQMFKGGDVNWGC